MVVGTVWLAWRTFFPRPRVPAGEPQLKIFNSWQPDGQTDFDFVFRAFRHFQSEWVGAITFNLNNDRIVAIGPNRSDPAQGHVALLARVSGAGELTLRFPNRPVAGPNQTPIRLIPHPPWIDPRTNIAIDLTHAWQGPIVMANDGTILAVGQTPPPCHHTTLFTVQASYDPSHPRIVLPPLYGTDQPYYIRLP